jgi:hypothetical protein
LLRVDLALSGDLFVDAACELACGVVALQLHEVIARGDLDEQGQVASGRDREANVWFLHAEELVSLAADAEAVVLGSFDPLFELRSFE